MCIENILDLRIINFQLAIFKLRLYPMKLLLFIWWEWKDVVYYELLPQNESINSAKYCNQLNELKAAIAEKRPELANWRGVVFHHENIKSHIALAVRKNLLKFMIRIFYCIFCITQIYLIYYLFLLLKNFFHDKRFQSISEIKTHLEYFANKP